MNLLQTLMRPDREEMELGERTLVAKAANILQVGEFQLLQLAYQGWHNRDLPEALVSQLFSSYMLKNEVPHWARHYARMIIHAEANNALNDNAPDFHVYDHEYRSSVPGGVRRFWTAVGMLTLFIGGAIILADLSVTKPASQFPPYLNEEDLKVNKSSILFGRADKIPASISQNSSLPDLGVPQQTGMLPAPP
ncbi:MAG: hypothetical protein HOL66_00400 [Rhodospirillaceae bacterium]|jgi:hypothetical protein|nr:hypothetical protein [Rhodospirillaceae bacterium]MBT5242683.1 hypothetical protein [Rhodospirillaceae bacterium]MBT5561496.1 hypothetical protein [Rhodospirillaceae bacterium]MBT6241906.1 hypothetical protein [Rhodospirillaceae bacterium]MBT7138707.1 hypothetical protein [Rhodospirillaceae bacterium]